MQTRDHVLLIVLNFNEIILITVELEFKFLILVGVEGHPTTQNLLQLSQG